MRDGTQDGESGGRNAALPFSHTSPEAEGAISSPPNRTPSRLSGEIQTIFKDPLAFVSAVWYNMHRFQETIGS